MPIDFYSAEGSPPCGLVAIVAEAIDLELNHIEVDFKGNDHLKPAFLKLNPQHTVPTINDNGFALWESRAIITYLVDKYAKTDSLFPKDAQKRAVINQRLQFDQEFYSAFSNYYSEQLIQKKPANPDKLKRLETSFEFLNTFLDGQTYVANNTLSLADFSVAITISALVAMNYDFNKYANIVKWYAYVKTVIPNKWIEKTIADLKAWADLAKKA